MSAAPGPPAANSGRIVTDYEAYLFGEGHWLRAWEKMGARPAEVDGVRGYSFVIWAPNARRVSIVGDFNGWDGRLHQMRKRIDSGLWEIFAPGLVEGAAYKYEIISRDGRLLPLKADPVGFAGELRPSTASLVARTDHFVWSDEEFLARRQKAEAWRCPGVK